MDSACGSIGILDWNEDWPLINNLKSLPRGGKIERKKKKANSASMHKHLYAFKEKKPELIAHTSLAKDIPSMWWRT